MVKDGYKQTDIGVFPDDWEIIELRKPLGQLEAGTSVNSSNDIQSTHRILKTSAVHNGKVDIKESKEVIPSDIPRLKCPVRQGSIIISRMNTPQLVGECGYVSTSHHDVYLPDRLWQTRNVEGYDYRWLNYLLNLSYFRNAVRASATGTSNSMKNISKDDMYSILIPCPRNEEQKAIAEALSDIDALIDSLEKLIEKKKAIKQGAMQELLTGKRRLDGFSGEWHRVELGKVGHLQKNTINPQDYPQTQFTEYSMPAYDDAQFPKITYGVDMHSNRIIIDGTILLFNKLNVRQKRIWYVEHAKKNAVCSAEFLPYYSDELDLRFLAHLLSTEEVTNDFIGMSTGTSNSQKRITPKNFLEYTVHVAKEKTEQSAIADILCDMDREIKEIEIRVDKYKKIKIGMMAELLTGRIRLI